MTALSEAALRLQIHAQGTENADDPLNLSDSLWMLENQAEFPWEMEPIWSSLLQAFDELNGEVNKKPDPFIVNRELSYAINGLFMLCLNATTSSRRQETIQPQITELTWRIAVAWDAILAGDIDSIREQIELERKGRKFS